MRENGTDRDIALQIVGLVDDIGSLVNEFNTNQYGPNITVQPTDLEGAIGDRILFTLTASKQTGYQWQVKTPTTDWTNSTSPGAKTASLNVQASEERYSYLYRCIVTGAQGAQVISDEVKILRPTT